MSEPRRERPPGAARAWSTLALRVIGLTIGAIALLFVAEGVLPTNPLFYAATGVVLWGLWRLADTAGRRSSAAGGAVEAIALLVATLGSVLLFFAIWDRFGG